ncbi:cell division protein FtsQ/DivIB [Sediminihabitans luteus]|uniref:cell division protein FtsQ/DivIB n=1 Tax=Sediminihabitans luteus TaxID=1138585 RepID=UPI0012FD5E0E|nr:cell division protein FtsQ/DivIB [Sediminihabitans luteus]
MDLAAARARRESVTEGAGGRQGAATAERPVVSHGVQERLAEKRAMRRRRAWTRALVWIVSLAALGGLVWVAFFSDVLALDPDQVEVVGVGEYVDAEQVDAVVSSAAGVPLPRVATGDLREQVLALRGVGDVEVSREWPRGLRVEVTPRTPAAAVPDDGGFALLDADGVEVASVKRAPAGLPQIDLPLAEVREESSGGGRRTLNSALVVLNAMPEALRERVRHVGAETQDDVMVTLDDGTVVEWGGADDVALKVRVLELLMAAPESAGAATYDVSAPRMPITRGTLAPSDG